MKIWGNLAMHARMRECGAQVFAALGARVIDRCNLTILEEPDQDEGLPIRVADHCFGCTAGQGSSCGGALGD